MDFKGKVVFVTGASRGIGEYIAYEFASLGADVALMAKTTNEHPHRVFPGTVEETAEKVESYGVRALAIQGDVSHEDDVQAAYERTMEAFGRCDIVVNNAAVSYVAPFLELTAKRWQILLNVNVLGPVLVAKAFLPQMIERSDGRIINITSHSAELSHEAADMGEGAELGDQILAYAASKAALNRFTVGLAKEMYQHGIAVNGLGVNAASPAFRYNLPNADLSEVEPEEAPAQVVCWLADQPREFTARILAQHLIIDDLRAKGIVRPKVDPT